MEKKSNSKSGVFNPRVLLGFVLCSVGVSLAMLSFAAPASTKKLPPQNGAQFKPVVIKSNLNGVSAAARDLPTGVPTGPREIEHGLLRVKPNHPVPAGFVDRAMQSVAQNLAVLLAMPAPLSTFEGQGSVDSGGGGAAGCLCLPPDTNGAVGPTQYVQMVNTVFSVYDKTGTRLSGPTPINALFSALPASSRCRATNDGDPVVVYDQLADRWLLSQFAVRDDAGGTNGPYEQCIAISQTSDATGAYYVYDFPLSTTKFEDYPHLGLWPDAYYMTTHQFNQAGTAYLGQAAWALERDRMLKGQPAQLLYFDLGALPPPFNTGFGGQLPANVDGFTLPPAGAPNYFVEVDSSADVGLGNNLRIWKFHVDWATPANSSYGVAGMPNFVIPITDFARPNCMNNAVGCVPQAGDASQLDPIGDRLMYRLAYRNFGDHESLVLNHTVVASATTGQMGPRWYEVRDPGGTPTIFQQSTWGPTSQTDLLYRWMSSVAMDRAGNMAIGYSTSNQITFPSIAYAGRLASDPPNVLSQGEAQLFAGTGPQHGGPTLGRWGDYTDMTVDPVDDCTFWYTNEYYSATDAGAFLWRTRVGSFKFPQCTPRPIGILRGTVTDSNGSNPIAGASVTAGGYTAVTNGSGFYQFSPLAPGAYTATASATGYFSSSPTAVTVTNATVTTQDFVLTRNLAVPTPTPAPPIVLQTVNPPVLNDPGGTITTNNYAVTWSPAEVTTGLASYIVEESTDYANPLFDNADGTAIPGDAASLWTAGQQTDPWIPNPAFHNSVPNSYFAGGEDSGFAAPIDTSLTLKSNITIPAGVGSGRLTFYSRYFNDPEDTGNIEISKDGGTLWNSLKILTDAPLVPPADTRVQNYEIDLTAYKGVPIKLRFRFNTARTLYPAFHTLGWWVDDINVDGATWKQIGTTGGGTTSLNITNRPNGHYYYRVRGVYSNGNLTTHSNVQDIIVNFPLTSVVSRMSHDSITPPFDINLFQAAQLCGPAGCPRGVECRSSTSLGAGNYTMVFKFPNNLMSVTSASVTGHDPTTATGTVSTSMVDSSDTHNYIVNLTGVSTGQYITVTLNNVHDVPGNIGNVTSPQMGVLVGDVDASGRVDSTDVFQVRQQTLQNAGASNFRTDLDASGRIDSTDVFMTRQQTLTSLPSPP
jgi:carboxypeptidase family protein/dockerin type I repeat protein